MNQLFGRLRGTERELAKAELRETEITDYGIMSWQHSVGKFDTQTSFTALNSDMSRR